MTTAKRDRIERWIKKELAALNIGDAYGVALRSGDLIRCRSLRVLARGDRRLIRELVEVMDMHRRGTFQKSEITQMRKTVRDG